MARFTGSATQRTTEPITVAAPNKLASATARTTEPITIAAPNLLGSVIMRTTTPVPTSGVSTFYTEVATLADQPAFAGALDIAVATQLPSALPWTYWDGAAEQPVAITYWDGAAEQPLSHDQVFGG